MTDKPIDLDQDPRRQKLIAAVVADFKRLSHQS